MSAYILNRIAEIEKERADRIQSYRDACSATSHRQLFNKLNEDIDRQAQGLTGTRRAEYEAMKSRKLAEADARDRENEAFWDALV
ncbi:hypothetical protein [Acetobacter tropicalis]|uniref:Uncharacterized protein n=1 Tax=Acetobacter tropicalis TaxID=104102 RepID=A0A511FKV7_9PROT|nr:hypothetical protein [Acetobacter tropicalis]KXV47770.1 hypothetical protein AD944_11375 [Acetobacter tropicalis]GEL49852.1 hypothetical protein ATR01nite_09270 [Acetobacter tropicalis]